MASIIFLFVACIVLGLVVSTLFAISIVIRDANIIAAIKREIAKVEAAEYDGETSEDAKELQYKLVNTAAEIYNSRLRAKAYRLINTIKK